MVRSITAPFGGSRPEGQNIDWRMNENGGSRSAVEYVGSVQRPTGNPPRRRRGAYYAREEVFAMLLILGEISAPLFSCASPRCAVLHVFACSV